MPNTISIDVEATGIDLRSGALPFLVSVCDEEGNQKWWEFDVEPETRRPLVPGFAEEEIRAEIEAAERLVLQNSKFDILALHQIGVLDQFSWPWEKTEDTLIAGHLLASNHKHDLTSMTRAWVGLDLEPLEKVCEEVVKEARKIALAEFPDWRLAKKGLDEMPSAKEKTWKYDLWLPRAIAKERNWPEPRTDCEHDWAQVTASDGLPLGCSKCNGHRFWIVTRDYCNGDTFATINLWKEQEQEIKQRRQWNIYRTMISVIRPLMRIADNSMSISKSRLEQLDRSYSKSVEERQQRCITLADGEIEALPVNGRSNDLNRIVFEKFGLSHPKRTDSGQPSMDQSVLEDWQKTLDPSSKPWQFINELIGYRKRKTALAFLASYQRYWHPADPELNGECDWHKIHWNINPSATDHLRKSSSGPNGQQLSKKEIAELGEKGHNLRWMFGPMPGREWFSMDFENIELRIPAYESGEDDLIWIFEHPDDPPYFGSYHLLIADLLFPREFREVGGEHFKERFKATLYQYTKNGNFAMQYGGQRSKVDATFHCQGAFDKIGRRFAKREALNKKIVAFAEKHGYVETVPDRSVDSKHGYPILCSRTEHGGIKLTTPLNYHTSGTACWVMIKAEIRCDAYLSSRKAGGGKNILEVHDELVFDFPKRADPRKKNLMSNWPFVLQLKRLMEEGGRDINIPTPVSIEWHPESWEQGIKL